MPVSVTTLDCHCFCSCSGRRWFPTASCLHTWWGLKCECVCKHHPAGRPSLLHRNSSFQFYCHKVFPKNALMWNIFQQILSTADCLFSQDSNKLITGHQENHVSERNLLRLNNKTPEFSTAACLIIKDLLMKPDIWGCLYYVFTCWRKTRDSSGFKLNLIIVVSIIFNQREHQGAGV